MCNLIFFLLASFRSWFQGLWLPKTPFALKSMDGRSPPLVSSHSYVQAACFRMCFPLCLLPDSGRLAIGDPRTVPTDQLAAGVAAWACSPDLGGAIVLDLAFAPLVRLALRARHREAENGRCLASPGNPPAKEHFLLERDAGVVRAPGLRKGFHVLRASVCRMTISKWPSMRRQGFAAGLGLSCLMIPVPSLMVRIDWRRCS
jgi:hypothetical protein